MTRFETWLRKTREREDRQRGTREDRCGYKMAIEIAVEEG